MNPAPTTSATQMDLPDTDTILQAPRITKTRFSRAVWAIVLKDVLAEFRSRELISSMGIFALLSIFIFSFALELDRLARQEAISGVLWVTVAFASILGLNRSMALERERGSMSALLMAPIDRVVIFFGKLIANYLFALIVGLILLPIMTVLYNMALLDLRLLGILILGTLGFSTIGTLLVSMTIQTRARDSLLPIVMLPIALPVILASVKASTAILNGADEWIGWGELLFAIDAVYLVVCTLMFDFIVDE